MKCKDVQKKLPAYAEGIIPPEEKIPMDEHLKSCPKCNESLADLRKTIDYVHGLEDIEPPAWLTQKVMAKIKSEVQPKKGIIQRLFYPLHIKLPLEAAVTVLIAVITIYIFKTMPPEMKLAQAPSEHESVIARSPSKVDSKATPKEQIAPTQTPDDRERLLLQEKTKGKENLISSPLTGSTHLEREISPPPPLEKGGEGGFKADHPAPAKEPMIMGKLEEAPQLPAQVSKQDEVRPSAGAIVKEEAKTEVLSRAAKAKREVLNVTVAVKDLKKARAEIKAALIHLGGKIIKTESLENKEIVTAEIDSQKYQEFIARLKSIGDVKEKEVDLKALEGHIEITIEILEKSW